MNLTIIAIGKMKKGSPEKNLIDTYVKQSLWPIRVVELEEKKSLTGPALKQAESELLLKHVPQGAKIIALDERGINISSRDFTSGTGLVRSPFERVTIRSEQRTMGLAILFAKTSAVTAASTHATTRIIMLITSEVYVPPINSSRTTFTPILQPGVPSMGA